MPRSLKAILACVFLLSFLAIITVDAPPLSAATYELTATWPGAPLWGFALDWTDTNHGGLLQDGLFQLDELVPESFTGVRFGTDTMYTFIDHVPGVSTWSSYTGGSANYWMFGYYDSSGVPQLRPSHVVMWTYARTEVVPLPPSVFLLGAGLIGLAGWRRFRKS